jgi:hypothetical protein
MQDQIGGRVLELGAIRAVEPLAAIIPAPQLALGTLPVEQADRFDPVALADPRSFRVELGSAPLLAGDEQAVEHGKRRR